MECHELDHGYFDGCYRFFPAWTRFEVEAIPHESTGRVNEYDHIRRAISGKVSDGDTQLEADFSPA